MIKVALPISVQGLITSSLTLVDNLMVGRLGDTAVSAVYMGNQFQTVLQMFVFGIDAAMLIIAAQYWGIRDTKSIRRIAAMGIRWSVLVGAVIAAIVLIFPRFLLGRLTNDAAVVEAAIPYVIFVALSYVFFCASQLLISTMKSVENAKLGFYVSLIALFVNIFLNWVLIFGKFGLPALGVKGAAIATLISRIVEFLIAAVYVFVIDKRLGLKIPDLLLYMKDCLSSSDYILIFLATLAMTLVGMVEPKVYQMLTGPVLESKNMSLLVGTAIFLLSAAFASQMLSVVRSLLMNRISSKTSLAVEAAVMMRVLALPLNFFRRFSSGELSSRTSAVSSLCPGSVPCSRFCTSHRFSNSHRFLSYLLL